MTHNNLRLLHSDLTELPNLRMLNCRDNKLSNSGLPENLFSLDDLSVLVGTDVHGSDYSAILASPIFF